MAIRLLSRIEPFYAPKDAPRAIARFMALVGAIGCIPGAYALFLSGAGACVMVASASPMFFVPLLVFAYFVQGFRQFLFYLRRSSSADVSNARKWWMSSYFYNLIAMALSLVVFVDKFEVVPLVSAAWFGALSLMCLVARAGERPLSQHELGGR